MADNDVDNNCEDDEDEILPARKRPYASCCCWQKARNTQKDNDSVNYHNEIKNN